MDPQAAINLDHLLAFAAIMLGLSLLVQVVQELFKFLSSAQARVFRQTLVDTCGPWIEQLYEAGPASRLHVRTPFQFIRSKPSGVLLPKDKDELLQLVDLSASDWVSYLLEALKSETELQADGAASGAAPSPRLRDTVTKILQTKSEEASEASSELEEVASFVERWELGSLGESKDGTPKVKLAKEIEPPRLLQALYQELMPERARLEREYAQIQSNYRHVYHRRNLRYSFLLGLLVAVALNFPLDSVWERASSRTGDEAVAMASEMLRISDEMMQKADLAADAERAKKLQERADEILAGLAVEESTLDYAGLERWRSDDAVKGVELARYLWYCLFTAVLVSFGAPFWHRITEALVRTRTGSVGGGSGGGSGGSGSSQTRGATS